MCHAIHAKSPETEAENERRRQKEDHRGYQEALGGLQGVKRACQEGFRQAMNREGNAPAKWRKAASDDGPGDIVDDWADIAVGLGPTGELANHLAGRR